VNLPRHKRYKKYYRVFQGVKNKAALSIQGDDGLLQNSHGRRTEDLAGQNWWQLGELGILVDNRTERGRGGELGDALTDDGEMLQLPGFCPTVVDGWTDDSTGSSRDRVLGNEKGVEPMQLYVVVRVVVQDCSERTPDRRIERSSVMAHGGRQLGSRERDDALVTESVEIVGSSSAWRCRAPGYGLVVPAAPRRKGW
jgi:hypothetical protein